MENNNELSKGTKIKVAIITVLVILTTLAGISYAFFSIGVIGNEEASSVTVTAALLRLTYSDNLVISGNGIYPGWSQSKTISVENTGTDTVYYKIIWRELLNEITNDELTISATCVASSGTCPAISEKAINTYTTQTSNVDIKNGIEIASGVTHTYTVTVTFKEMSSAQNYNQGKSFYGTLNIAEGSASTELEQLSGVIEYIGEDSETGLPMVAIDSEEFYILNDVIDYDDLTNELGDLFGYDEGKTILLAKYSLNVGMIYSERYDEIEDETYETYTPITTGYGLQSSVARGWTDEEVNGIYTAIGVVPFCGSSTGYGYWDPDESGIDAKYGTYTNYANNIYDTAYVTAPNYSASFYNDATNANYSIAYYVEEYINRLGLGSNAEGRLLTYPEAEILVSEAVYAVYNETSYWLGSAGSDYSVWYVISGGGVVDINFDYTSYYGVRPVIIVSTSDIQ